MIEYSPVISWWSGCTDSVLCEPGHAMVHVMTTGTSIQGTLHASYKIIYDVNLLIVIV